MNELPQYRKLYEALRKQILSGTYAEGCLLPSEHELSSTWQIARPTVRQSLDALVRDGLILKKQGKGSIVRKPLQNIGILSASGTASAIGASFLKTKILQKPVVFPWDWRDPATRTALLKAMFTIHQGPGLLAVPALRPGSMAFSITWEEISR